MCVIVVQWSRKIIFAVREVAPREREIIHYIRKCTLGSPRFWGQTAGHLYEFLTIKMNIADLNRVQLALEELICSVCHELFERPRVLTCQHTFCETCLYQCHSFFNTLGKGDLAQSWNPQLLSCPECRHRTQLPANGVEGLPRNFKLARLVEILSQREKDIIRQKLVLGLQQRNESAMHPRCVTHPTKMLEYYCQNCRDLICSHCLLSAHRDHTQSVLEADGVLPLHLNALSELTESTSETLQGAENIMDSLAEDLKTMRENEQRALLKVRRYFGHLKEVLSERERHFLAKLHHSLEERRGKITKKRKDVKQSIEGLIVGLKVLNQLSQRKDVMVLRDEKAIVTQIKTNITVVTSVQEELDSQETDTTVVMPCYEDQNLERLCWRAGDPSYRFCPQDCPNNPSPRTKGSPLIQRSRSPSQSPNGAIPPIPPKPVHLKDAAFSLRPDEKGSGNVGGDDTRSIPASPTSIVMNDRLSSVSSEEGVRENEVEPESAPDILPKGSMHRSALLKPPIPKPRNRVNYNNVVITNKEEAEEPLARCSTMAFLKSSHELHANDELKPPEVIKPRSHSDAPLPPLPMKTSPPSPTEDISVAKTRQPLSEITPKQVPVLEITSKQMQGSPSVRRARCKNLVYPHGVCVGPNDMLIVTDVHSQRVSLLTSNGRFLDFIAKEGSADGQINEPVGAAVDSSGDVIVLEANCPRIQRFTHTGIFVSKIFPKMLRSASLGDPRGIAVANDGTIFVTDWEKSTVQAFDSTGKHLLQFSQPLPVQGSSMKQPTGIAVDPRGRVIITDTACHKIFIYTPEGEPLKQFGWEGSWEGDLDTPFGVTTDKKGNIIVSEVGNHRISVFTSGGNFVTSFGGYGSDLGQFNCPKHICIDSEGRLLVADEGNSRIQVFRLS